MILDNYVKLACVTESPVTTINDLNPNLSVRLLHGVMGICTEIGELIVHTDTVNLGEEIADSFWYTAIICDELQLDFKTIVLKYKDYKFTDNKYTTPYIINKLVFHSAEALDKLKKNIFYGKEIKDIENDIEYIFTWLIYLCINNDINIEDILEKNIAKLKARYGDKFNSYFAINRDLNKERQILEGKLND